MQNSSEDASAAPGVVRDATGAGFPTLAETVGVLERLYPPETAQSWDRVGLVAGDPEQQVARILLAVDPTLAVIAEAVALGFKHVESAPLVRSSYHARDQVPGAELKALRRRQATLDAEGRIVPAAS